MHQVNRHKKQVFQRVFPCLENFSITIKDSIFEENFSNFDSNCLTFTGIDLSITSKLILIFILTELDCSFLFNVYNNPQFSNKLVGHGSVNFLGKVLSIFTSIFSKNTNSAGGAIFIGGSKNYFETIFVISNVNFSRNSAWAFGGAVSFGSDIIQVQGTFTKINCYLDFALCKKSHLTTSITNLVGGALYIIFQSSNSLVIISECFFYSNGGYVGGAIYAQHAGGLIYIKKCMFIQNFVIDLEIPGEVSRNDANGGAIAYSCYGISFIKSEENIFMESNARSGVVCGISGILIDYNSEFKGFLRY